MGRDSLTDLLWEAAWRELEEARAEYVAEKARLRSLGYGKRAVGMKARGPRLRHQRAWWWLLELAERDDTVTV